MPAFQPFTIYLPFIVKKEALKVEQGLSILVRADCLLYPDVICSRLDVDKY